jgi:predicted O-methyltransferase YrrM
MDNYLPKVRVTNGLRAGRNVYEGYQRGWGLERTKLPQSVRSDPLFAESLKVAVGRSAINPMRRMNLFLILRFFLQNIPQGNIIEFGSYRGGTAMFMAAVCKGLGLDTRVYALDTFEGMPETDSAVDLFAQKSFSQTNYAEIVATARAYNLTNIEFVKGLFQDTAKGTLDRAGKIALAHIDCDIRSGVIYSYEVVKPYLVPGAYIVFDDATSSGCIGATEAVEEYVIARDGKLSEQIFPHFVFRHWPA